MTKELEFVPILLGNDINSYSVARAFHEEYSVRSIIIGKFRSGPNNNSNLSDLIILPDIENPTIFLKTLDEIRAKYAGKKLILIGCGDTYVQLIITHKKILSPSFIIPYIDEELMNDLIHKEKFYAICKKYNLDYPQTLILTKDMGVNYHLDFPFPVILKPANGILYWKHPFPGNDKVFKLNNKEELDSTAKKIFDSGYTDSLIVQDFIPGDDSMMRVMTCYSDKSAQVKLMSLGHVLLEEHTPHGLGNHAVILNTYDKPLSDSIKSFLEEIRYIGFSNFDIKYDSRDKKYKLLEINLRQGRSNFYVTGSGDNIAKYLVEDYIKNVPQEFKLTDTEHLWLVVPKSIALKYTKSKELREKISLLSNTGRSVNPLFYRGDYRIKRLLFLIKSHLSHHRKYKKYYK